jgi:3-mercaptopyruvate sulfurtransferase SseA
MKKTLLVTSILILATLACNATLQHTEPTITPTEVQAVPTQPKTQGQTNLPLTEADVPRVTPKDAKLALEEGKAVIVDVRGTQYYAEGHVAGAISIPLEQIENNVKNVPLKKDQWIITYCT